MKKYLLASLALGALLLNAPQSYAQMPNMSEMMQFDLNSPYVLGEIGYSFGTENTGDAGLVGIGAGYQLNDYFKSDFTIGYRGMGNIKFQGTPTQKTDINSVPMLANMYMSIPMMDRFSAYGMGGLGISINRTSSDDLAGGKTKTSFAWTTGLGIEYAMSPCMTMDLGYRYTNLGQAKINGKTGYVGKTKSDVTSNDVKLTARFHF